MINLQRLADALNACGISVLRADETEIWYPWGGIEMWWNPSEGEASDLAFRMLDELDRAKNEFGTRYYFATGATPNVIKDGKSIPREDGMTHYCGSHYGPSRTAAIALCFMAATDAGLISVGSSGDANE